jgi:hypothetical protein
VAQQQRPLVAALAVRVLHLPQQLPIVVSALEAAVRAWAAVQQLQRHTCWPPLPPCRSQQP